MYLLLISSWCIRLLKPSSPTKVGELRGIADGGSFDSCEVEEVLDETDENASGSDGVFADAGVILPCFNSFSVLVDVLVVSLQLILFSMKL